ncbi:TonB-dependent receptor [candidate division KSB1 bacterium]|nr:TonB-dependent receptor [candidate division KSB1 bacterium]
MKNRILISSMILVFVLVLAGIADAAVTGKITGKVIDAETKEPLPGANVTIEGTFYGSATNVDGEYIILNVPPGNYTLRAQFIGYRSVIVREVLVIVDLTTETNFELPSEALAMSSITVVADRPLVQKNATNEVHVMTSDEIENMPMRNYAAVVATNSGVVTARNDLHVRGGRRDEVAYYVDGVYSNDLRTGRRIGEIPINSVEQINYQAGGFNAEYGFANSGVVITSSKSGQNYLQISGEVATDEFLSKEEKYLDTYSYGYNIYNLALSGPIIPNKLKFFVAGEYNFFRDRNPSSSTYPTLAKDFTQAEIDYTEAQLIALGIPESDWLLPIKNMSGPLPTNELLRWNFNGNILLDLKSFKLKIGGNGTFDEYDRYTNSYALNKLSHTPHDVQNNYSVYGKITHALTPSTYYEATGYFTEYFFEDYDPYFERNMNDYGDGTDYNGNGIYAPYISQNGTNPQSKIRLGSGVFAPLSTYDDYTLDRSNVLGAKLDVTHQIGLVHEIRTGAELRYNTIRRYNVVRPVQLAGIYSNDPTFDQRLAQRAAYTDNFGYPSYFEDGIVDPNETLDEGWDRAKHPIIAAYYLQDKIELSDLVLNLGLRWDYIDANDWRLKDPYDIKIKNGFLDYDQLEKTEGHSTISPRVGISFPVTDKTVFHAQWGKFTQQPELQYLYTGWDVIGGQLAQGNQVTVGNPDLKPVKTTSYEVGFGQQLGLNASFNVTAYYKEIRDLLVLKNRINAVPRVYAQYQNGDYGTVKGLSFNFRLRRIERVSANVNYSLQWAKGTGSTAGAAFYITWIGNEYYPTFVFPLDYDQRHTLSANVDFRTNPDDGPMIAGMYPFGNLGFNLLATAGSGFPYTPKRVGDTVFAARFSTAFPVAATNSAYTNWTYNFDMRVDKTINIGKMDFNLYLWVINLLGTQNPFQRRSDRGQDYADGGAGVYEATGRVDDNGWLDTVEGQQWVLDNGGENAAAMYRALINNPRNWEEPRQIRLGLRFNITP